jgi:L-alanine-DL-glutamate epimerase-like enolase superfamily enzyme
MKIKSIRTYSRSIPLTKPYTIAYNTYYSVELCFLEVELQNGICGYGSASPAEEVTGESISQTKQNLQSAFFGELEGKDIRLFRKIIDDASAQFPKNPATLAALDMALHDAFCKCLEIPVVSYLGQKIRSLPTSVTLGINTIEETLKHAAEFLKMGFKVLKIKTGLSVEEDIERTRRIHEMGSSDLLIRVDANQGYDLAGLKKFMNATANLRVELIEQPLKTGQESELLAIDEPMRKMLAGDESVIDPHSAFELASGARPFGIYNIKLMKCGGIVRAREMAAIARQAGIGIFWGCNDESLVSITAALHAAYSCINTKYLDLDGSFDLAEDLFRGGFELNDGFMEIVPKPGFGITKID